MKKSRDSGAKEEEDRALWDYVTRGIKAYDTGKPKSPPQKPAIRKETAPARIKPLSPCNAPIPKGFDRSTETKLRRGQLPLEGRIDLHGMTQTEAYDALHKFIHAAVAQEKRTLLVITGKGRRFEGVLRQMVPQWLEAPPLARYLLAVTPAQPKDGGTGAFYLRLRKLKQ